MCRPSPRPPTYFDRPERSAVRALEAQVSLVRTASLVTAVLEGLPGPTMVLNAHRQILVTNRAASSLIRTVGHTTNPEGLRLGEALACINVVNGPAGCGTAPQCRYCGAGKANRAFRIAPGTFTGEFRLRSGEGAAEQALTLAYHLSPLLVEGRTLGLCALTDLTPIRHREAIEHVFFHDVLNTVQAVQGAADLLPVSEDDEERDLLARTVSENARELVGEIQAQRDLLAAEDGNLTVPMGLEQVSAIVERLAELYRHSRLGERLLIDVQRVPGNDTVTTSGVHLSRCVGNLLKNAIEAAARGDTVRVRITPSQEGVQIDVSNRGAMPPAVQAQVFQRSFSTKAATGRGLGTYGVRLLVTKYLGGAVSFVSTQADGTTFTIRLPRTPDVDMPNSALRRTM